MSAANPAPAQDWCPGSNAAADVPPFGAMPRRWPCPICGDEVVIQNDGSAAPHVVR